MEFNYDKETDSLSIRLCEGSYLETEEVANDIMLDFDHDGALTAIEILSVEENATPSKLHTALQNLPEELTPEERRLVKLAFDQIAAGKHRQSEIII